MPRVLLAALVALVACGGSALEPDRRIEMLGQRCDPEYPDRVCASAQGVLCFSDRFGFTCSAYCVRGGVCDGPGAVCHDRLDAPRSSGYTGICYRGCAADADCSGGLICDPDLRVCRRGD